MVGLQVPPASPPAHAEAADPPAPPPRLPRVKRLPQPDRAAHQEHIASLQAQIDDLQSRILEIKDIVDNKNLNRHVASPELLQARNRLTELNAAFKAAVETKRGHREELDLAEKFRERLRSDARSLRQKLPFVKVEQIDEEIRKLEYRQTHTTLSIEEEKKLVARIANLRRSREFVKDLDQRTEQDEDSRTKLLDLIKEDDRLLNSLKVQQEQQRHILAEIREKEAAKAMDIPALLQEKTAAYEKIKAFREEIKQARIDFEGKLDEFWNREREWKSQQAQERRIKAEKVRTERLEREKIRKQRELENFVEPYTDEIIMCDQLITFLNKLAPTSEELHALPSQQQKVETHTLKGFGEAIVSKKNRNEEDLEGWFGGFGGKKGKKGKAAAPIKSKEREKITFSLDVLTSFAKVKVPHPATYGDVIKSLEELKKKKENYLDMQKRAKYLRENPDLGGVLSDAEPHEVASVDGEDVASTSNSSFQDSENGMHTEFPVLSGQVPSVSDGSVLETSENGNYAQVHGSSVGSSDLEIVEASEPDSVTHSLVGEAKPKESSVSGVHDEVPPALEDGMLQGPEEGLVQVLPDVGNELLQVPQTEVHDCPENRLQKHSDNVDVPETTNQSLDLNDKDLAREISDGIESDLQQASGANEASCQAASA